MKAFLRKISTVAFTLMVTLTFLIVPFTDTAHAEWDVREMDYSKSVTVVKYKDTDTHHYGIDMTKQLKNAKKVKVKSSKKGILSDVGEAFNYIVFYADKAGTTTLKVNVTKKSGKKVTYKIKVCVLNSKKIFKSVKLGRKNCTKKLIQDNENGIKYKAKTGKISIKPADGWRLYGKIRYYSEKGDPYDPFEKGVLYKKTYKNNQRIKFRKGCTNHTIYFKMKHKKTGLIEYFTLHIDR